MENEQSLKASRYTVRYVHKISPSAGDTGPDAILLLRDTVSRKELGRVLRGQGILAAGVPVRDFRWEGDNLVLFPGGSCQIWHSLIHTYAGVAVSAP